MTYVSSIKVFDKVTGEDVTCKTVAPGSNLVAKITVNIQASGTYWIFFYVSTRKRPASLEETVFYKEWKEHLSSGVAEKSVEWVVNYPEGKYYICVSVLWEVPGVGWYPADLKCVEHYVSKVAPPTEKPKVKYVAPLALAIIGAAIVAGSYHSAVKLSSPSYG